MSNARFSILQSRAVSDQRISNAQFRTLAALGMFGDKDGWCFPKLQTIGDLLGKSKQAVSMDIKALQEYGYVQVTPKYRDDGSQKNNLYRLMFDTTPLSPPEPPLSPEVDGGLSPELNGGLSSEVDALTPHNNVPINAPLEHMWERDILELYSMGDLGVEALKTKLNPVAYVDLVNIVNKFGIEKFITVLKYYAVQNYTLPVAIGKAINAIPTWRWEDKKPRMKKQLGPNFETDPTDFRMVTA